ncbi:MAG TPA: carboxypeptidase-like regulatory domain-containing protein, partial [Fibrella sp.]
MKGHLLLYTALGLACFCGIPEAAAQLSLASVKKPSETIRVQENTTSLIALLKKLELIHKTSFVYQKELLEHKTFSGSVNENDKLEQILERVLTPANLRFRKLKGGDYTILPRNNPKVSFDTGDSKPIGNSLSYPETGRELAVASLQTKADLQTVSTGRVADIVVKGKVIDTEKGEPIPGVSIVLKGAVKGTNTDAKGDYSITVPDANAILVFSFVGF